MSDGCYKIKLQNIRQQVLLEQFRIFDAYMDVTCSPSKKGEKDHKNIISHNSIVKTDKAIASFGISLVLLHKLHFFKG